MKKYLKSPFMILLILSIALSFTTNPVKALPGGVWRTGIKIQNLSIDKDAKISITLLNQSGATVATIDTLSDGVTEIKAPIGGSIEIYLPDYTAVASGQYSAIVTSTEKVGVVATNTDYDYGMADSYNEMGPSQEVFVPYVYHNHNSWSTEIFVQNTSSTANAIGKITFVEPLNGYTYGDEGVHSKTIDINIPPLGVTSFDTSTSTFADLGWFIGSASINITSVGTPITVVSNQVRLMGTGDVPGNVLIQSKGLVVNADAGTKILLPSLYKEFSGISGTWRSGIKLQNPNDTPVTVDVLFKADATSPSGPFEDTATVTISANNSEELYLNSLSAYGVEIPNMFIGSAVVNVTSGTSVISSVQSTNYSGGNGYGVALGYTGFSTGTSIISVPSLYRWPSGSGIWVSGVKIQNVGNDPVHIVMDLKADGDVSLTWTGKVEFDLNPGDGREVYLGADNVLDSSSTGSRNVPIPWKGSAFVTATPISGTDAKIAATILHTNYGRHVANMYLAIPMIP